MCYFLNPSVPMFFGFCFFYYRLKIFFYSEDNCSTVLCWFLPYGVKSAISTHMSSPSRTSLPPPPPTHASRLSQSTGLSSLCSSNFPLAIHSKFLFVPPSLSTAVSTTVFSTCVHAQLYQTLRILLHFCSPPSHCVKSFRELCCWMLRSIGTSIGTTDASWADSDFITSRRPNQIPLSEFGQPSQSSRTHGPWLDHNKPWPSGRPSPSRRQGWVWALSGLLTFPS